MGALHRGAAGTGHFRPEIPLLWIRALPGLSGKR